ncbi:pitrilysin family protein [Empedobacter sp. GD03797]|uniref:M16 family metallopeptidase n=1 Tax=Empedobacter sp. GD03797 TaxID=2975382 RepID=UPI00244C8681|nr:pitrilysin family protein [Empedobacter sp. GD03797]MDH1883739.1 insulinase family protein [Empedobacter sp. GD03797]
MKTKILSLAIAFMAVSLNAQVAIPMPKPGPAPTVNLGKSNEFKLKNGLTVIVVENHKLPRVSATLTIDNPPFALGAKKGAESLLSEMLGTGTKTKSKDDFNKRIEFLGARVNFWEEGASASSLTKYFNEIFGYMADGAMNPNFTESEFTDVKKRYIEGLKADEKSVEAAASRVSNILVYGKNNPFSEFDTPAQIEKITLQDVKDYYNTYYKPNNAYLIVVGDISTKDVKALAEKNFNSWQTGKLNIPAFPKVEEVTKTELNAINMPNAVQSVVSVSYPVQLTKKDPDYYAALIASSILGGDFNSKLNMNLREAHGWTYGARGGVSDSRYVGRFNTNATVRNEVTDSAIVETMKEIKEMTLNKIDQQTLNDVKAKFLGNFILTLESPSTVANQALTKKTNQLSDSFYADYIKNINAVTIDDVLRVSKKYFRPDQAKINVTGKLEQIAPALEKLGYPVNYYDSFGNKIDKPTSGAKTTTVSVAQITDNYLKAIGGADKVKAVKSIVQKGKIETMGQSGDYIVKATSNKIATSFTIMGMTFKQVFDGQNGYMSQAGQKMDLPTEMITPLKKTNPLFFPLSEGYKTAKVEGVVSEDGVEYYKVSAPEISRTDYYDVKTGLLKKTDEVQKTPQGDVIVNTKIKNYKAFDGILFPSESITETGPQVIKIVIDSGEINKNVTEADFK